MKIHEEDYKILENKIKLFVANNYSRVVDHKNELLFSGNYKDFDTRFSWDLFWACKFEREFTDKLYEYLNDEHITTALKKIVKSIK